MFTRRSFTCGGLHMSGYETEATVYGIVCHNLGNSFIGAGDLTEQEAPLSGGGKGITAHSSIYVGAVSNTVFAGAGASAHCYAGCVYFDTGGTVTRLPRL